MNTTYDVMHNTTEIHEWEHSWVYRYSQNMLRSIVHGVKRFNFIRGSPRDSSIAVRHNCIIFFELIKKKNGIFLYIRHLNLVVVFSEFCGFNLAVYIFFLFQQCVNSGRKGCFQNQQTINYCTGKKLCRKKNILI